MSEGDGGYIDSLYTRTRAPHVPAPELEGAVAADVCVVGGGIAGISTAWELAARGQTVVLLEARRLGWGASGRNGGILSPGFAASSGAILARSGPAEARALYDLSREGVETVLRNTSELGLKGVDPVTGVLSVSRYPDERGMRAWQEEARELFGEDLDYLAPAALRDLVKSERFYDALYHPNGHHIHPLNYCLGLARDLVSRGGQVFENSAMLSLEPSGGDRIVRTAKGQVTARSVVLCGSGYGGREFGRLSRALLPIATYVVSTPDLGARAGEIMATGAAVSDTRLSCDYFRITPGGALLWGGGMSGLAKSPANLAALMKARIVEVFPQLADVGISCAWTGLMGYARHKMPYVQEMEPGVWAATALGGHGLNTGPAIARVVAEAIAENGTRHRLFRPYGLRWNGSIFGPLAADGIVAASNFRHRLRERAAP